MAAQVLLFVLLLLVGPALLIRPPNSYLLRTPAPGKRHVRSVGGNVGERLILTDYLEAGKIEEAQNLSRVQGGPFPDDIPSYSGFFTINKDKGSNTFFWFFPAEHDYDNAPVVLWLQGGPGASSLFGLFAELGPFSVAADGSSLVRNPYSWHKNHSLVFVDNPVGTGFSYTSKAGYAQSDAQAGNDLYVAMVQFFTLFPNLQKNEFFIAGESYAGKFIPALGHEIHEKNPNATVRINLKGLVIGDGFTDPVNMVDFSDYAYQLGLVDNATWSSMKQSERRAVECVAAGRYVDARDNFETSMGKYMTASKMGVYNVLADDDDADDSLFTRFVQSDAVRAAIHVGDQPYGDSGDDVASHMIGDFMRSARPWVEELLDAGYRVVFYNGQLDLIVAYPLSENMFRQMRWSGAAQYAAAERRPWRVDGRLAGYVKTAGNMAELLVRDAGHMVPADQPAVAFRLIYQATRGTF